MIGLGDQALSEAECLDRLPMVPVGRVGITVQALPRIVPVTFRSSGRDVFFAAIHEGQLARGCDGVVIGFETDSYDPTTGEGWSVEGIGFGSKVDFLPEGLHPLRTWDSRSAGEALFRLRLEQIRGSEVR